MFILDTSAIRGIPGSTLRSACGTAYVTISTFTALELASHLNNADDELSFQRRKGNFCKCALPTILNDPFWTWSKKLGAAVNESRLDDKFALAELVRLATNVNSSSEFAEQFVLFPDGSATSCKAIGRRIADALRDEEDRFLERIKSKVATLQLDPKLNGSHELTQENFKKLLVSLSTTYSSSDWLLAAKAGMASAAYAGYVISRAYHYANKRPKGVSELNIDRNDCEDAYVCLHIDLARDDVLVTCDKGTIDALTNTTEMLNQIFDPPTPRRCVMDLKEFVDMFDAQAMQQN